MLIIVAKLSILNVCGGLAVHLRFRKNYPAGNISHSGLVLQLLALSR